MSEKDQEQRKDPDGAFSHQALSHPAPSHPEWREPPGYLGEAVRRAKLIPSHAKRREHMSSRD
jgi:hypothetical protein